MATLTLKSGYNITITEDPVNGTLTISATDTKYTIDSTLSGSSTNPVQNKVVYTALAGKQDKLIAGTGISISGNTISCTVSGGLSQQGYHGELSGLDSALRKRPARFRGLDLVAVHRQGCRERSPGTR